MLANEQVIAGLCERCDSAVEQRRLPQWYFKISQYAGACSTTSKRLDWSDTTRKAQANWIGRSEGAEVDFAVEGGGRWSVRVFTTRPDTLFGATYMVLAPEHPLVDAITTRRATRAGRSLPRRGGEARRRRSEKGRQGKERRIHRRLLHQSGERRAHSDLDRGLRADGLRHRRNHGGARSRRARLRVRAAFRVADRARDRRPPARAPRHPLRRHTPATVRWSTRAASTARALPTASAPSSSGWRNAGSASRRSTIDCTTGAYRGSAIGVRRSRSSIARSTARCRCRKRDLPVILPRVEDFKPDDSGISPLARVREWYETTCPKCGGPARRETDVSDTFLDSAWYFLRYPSSDRDDVAFDPELTRKWLPVHTLHRRQRARGVAPDVRPLRHDGAQGSRPHRLR